MSDPVTLARQSTVLIVAAPSSDWAPLAERHAREQKDVVVVFAHEQGTKLVRTVRDRMLSLASSGSALVAVACVGVLENEALREVVQAAGLRIS